MSEPDKLAKINAHPRDCRITFDEGPHIYTVDGVQDYDLQTLFADVSESGERITITRVYYESTPAISRFFDPYSVSGQGTLNLIDEFGFGSYSPAAQFILMPIFEDMLRIQAIEFNDQFTRAQFVSLVEPFLRDVQGRRGITDFRVVCDTTNNTPEVIDSNRFVGDIYIKPARSINFIQLNFVAVRTGVSFDEVVGKF